mmetsp:Transcript_1701/g.3395  ORF Transcript_1701/g.3395 Transcript_1701/m.3395 type:complete len:117 (-) Transcript_1701:157-507(-)
MRNSILQGTGLAVKKVENGLFRSIGFLEYGFQGCNEIDSVVGFSIMARIAMSMCDKKKKMTMMIPKPRTASCRLKRKIRCTTSTSSIRMWMWGISFHFFFRHVNYITSAHGARRVE